MTNSRKKTPSTTFAEFRQRKWINHEHHAVRQRRRNFLKSLEKDYDNVLECEIPTYKSTSNLYSSPSDMGKGDRAMLPLSEWFPIGVTMRNSWYRYCVIK